MKQLSIAAFLLVAIIGCKNPERTQKKSLDDIANQYVKLGLEIGQYDKDFVDAYYGPQQWKPEDNTDGSLPYEELKWQTTSLIHQLNAIDDMGFSELELLRYQFLNKQLQAIRTKLDMISGKRYPFDVESLRLYDVVAPHVEMSYYDSLLAILDNIVPGEGELSNRYADYSKAFIIADDKLDTVFNAAINEARQRVSQHIQLPENESFEIEYVNDKPWSGYNWFKGNAHSLIQINRDFPIYIKRAIELACHEGYPGHHLFNTMLEQKLVIEQGWSEYQIYPLFSPQSFIAEGSANYGIEVVFTPEERLDFEKNVLFPLAGIDTSLVEEYYIIQGLRKKLKNADIDIARAYINMKIDKEMTVSLLNKYLQYSPSKAAQRLNFYDKYRSYVINYTLGEEFIRNRITNELGEGNGDKWSLFNEILTTPRTATTL